MTYSCFGHMVLTPSLHFLNGSTVTIPSTLPGTLPRPVSHSWTSDVLIDQDQFRTSVCVKPTNHISHYRSCHSISTKFSIPYSLATQGRCICSHPDDLYIYTSNLTKAFTSLGYPAPPPNPKTAILSSPSTKLHPLPLL